MDFVTARKFVKPIWPVFLARGADFRRTARFAEHRGRGGEDGVGVSGAATHAVQQYADPAAIKSGSDFLARNGRNENCRTYRQSWRAWLARKGAKGWCQQPNPTQRRHMISKQLTRCVSEFLRSSEADRMCRHETRKDRLMATMTAHLSVDALHPALKKLFFSR